MFRDINEVHQNMKQSLNHTKEMMYIKDKATISELNYKESKHDLIEKGNTSNFVQTGEVETEDEREYTNDTTAAQYVPNAVENSSSDGNNFIICNLQLYNTEKEVNMTEENNSLPQKSTLLNT